MPQDDPSKTEDPTKKRIDKARKDGSVPRSQEVGKVMVVLAGLIGLYLYISYIGNVLMQLFQHFLSSDGSFVPSKQNVFRLVLMTSAKIALMVLPVLIFIAFIAYLCNRIQVGPLWTTKVFKPRFDKVFNVAAGIKKLMLNPKTFMRLGKSLLQAIVIGIAPYIVLKREMHNMAPLFYQNAHGLASYMLHTAGQMVLYALFPMLVITAADVWYTRWDYTENLKMTKDEVKDERKQAEGDPVVKQKQKQKMLAVMMRRMMQDVPTADVVITNPTHIAVALRYDPLEFPAPMVLAKGVDRVAQKIKEIAQENNVPIKENKPLAQALYKSVDIGEAIPAELYQAVASILAQLQKFKRPQTAA